MSDINDEDILEALKIADEISSQHEEDNKKEEFNAKSDNIQPIIKEERPLEKRKKKQNIPRKLKDPWSLKKKIIVTLIVLIIVFVAAPVTGLYLLRDKGRKSLEGVEYDISDSGFTLDNEGHIIYNGQSYSYNSNIINILCMAVDNDGYANRDTSLSSPDTSYDEDGNIIVNEEEDADNRNRDDEISYTDSSGTGYRVNAAQIDMCFLLVINKETKKTNIIYINRDSMTDVDIQDVNGDTVLSGNMQLTLAYAYGDGGEVSISNFENSVSHMLYNIPINGYILMDMNTISDLNDAVNGVTLIPTETVCEDVYADNVVTLKENLALNYMEYMDVVTTDIGSNALRINRQKQYIAAWYQRFKQKKDTGSSDGIKTVYNIFSENMYTDIDFKEQLYLYSVLKNNEMEVDNIEELPGEYTRTYHFDEYHLDEGQLQDMIIRYFYKIIN